MNNTPLTVTELTARIKQVLEQGFAQIELTGEISRLTSPASGHLYFTIKDAHAAISAVIWRSTVARLKTRPKEGQAYVFTGHLSLYEPRGTYQIVIQQVQAVGEGRLAAEFERRKQAFAEQGYFDSEHKRSIPPYPQHIGLVASSTSAAYADVQKVLHMRPAWLRITLSHCLVQGEQAPDAVVKALAKLHALPTPPDVILLVRGGGSMEDLWCFNDERIVNAVFAATIPIISGIGHEIDTTLTDLAADIRAATPSNAAELCCPSRETLRQKLPKLATMSNLLQRRLHLLGEQLRNSQQRQQHLINHLKDDQHWALERLNQKHQHHFRQHLLSLRSQLKQCCHRLQQAEPNQRLRRQTHDFYHLSQRLMACSAAISKRKRQYISNMHHRLSQLSKQHIQQRKQHFHGLHEHLHALNPKHILQRGYAMTTDMQGNVISSSQHLPDNHLLQLHFHDGVAQANIIQTSSSRQVKP